MATKNNWLQKPVKEYIDEYMRGLTKRPHQHIDNNTNQINQLFSLYNQLSGEFPFHLDYGASLDPITFKLGYDFRIDSITSDLTPITTITVNALPYTLGTTITAWDEVEVSVDINSVIQLNCIKL